MPTTPDSPRIAYERHGDRGPPVLLVMGFGMRGRVWSPQVELLDADHQLVTYDNRGIGESEDAARIWSMGTMADDARRVLDAVGWESAHVVGVSMGGMIAQELALAHPGRIRSLTLISTHAGGPGAFVPPLGGLRSFLGANLRPQGERVHALAHLLYPPEFLAVVDREVLLRRMNDQVGGRAPRRTRAKQLGAVVRHDTRARLPRLRPPTMVVRSGRDVLVRPDRQDALAALVPRPRLVRYDDAGHGLIFQRARALADELRGFVGTHEPS